MPIVQLNRNDDDRARLLAVMLFPSDDEDREFFFARQKIGAMVQKLDGDAKLEIEAKTLRTLLAAPSASESRQIRDRAAKAGHIAGDIFAMVYCMAEIAKTPMPSVNKAVHAYLAWGNKGATWGDGKPLPKSESEVRKAWSSHRSVSYLWAAARLLKDRPFTIPEGMFGANFGVFLRVAAGLLKFGCAFVPTRAKPPSPLLSDAECWSLPKWVPPRSLDVDRVPDLLRDHLKGYKAPQPMGY